MVHQRVEHRLPAQRPRRIEGQRNGGDEAFRDPPDAADEVAFPVSRPRRGDEDRAARAVPRGPRAARSGAAMAVAGLAKQILEGLDAIGHRAGVDVDHARQRRRAGQKDILPKRIRDDAFRGGKERVEVLHGVGREGR